jgi:hypothetical protein
MDTTLIIVSVVAVVVAVVMSAVAWRLLRDERLRSAARVAALARDIHQGLDPVDGNVPPRAVVDEFLQHRATAAASSSEMFTVAAPPSRLPLVAAVVVLVVGIAAGATLLTSGAGSKAQDSGRPGAAHASAPTPLELVALGHERDADGLTVRGVLRNPPTGTEVSHLTAVVLLFNREGGYIASGRAAVQAATLEPGRETTFVVTVSGAADVERYRVSFRTEKDVVPHVDHRS